ncbi:MULTISPECIES: type 1 glutamine amidotransferase domain-containing protein [unclassified Polaribacter]|jgi:protease I|uniref:type 1 glutamine amidotransferase domain-containing protein n=1 Tax=unclassified Polaribacter TaxID=196858 RepID=UPI001C4F0A07|nr:MULTISPECIES: type 1 glutamine amidotransferase domain-containing protein [unclassified Polaribacter]QXP63413.1 type 1 glutamine amidotransferase [Polaribacter sp. HaHaR_3_91]QXP65920.1 type 1 glutamine amidotransferase [Polaribacter sp. AHE13PA]QXP71406.1 type 1 glutamine amidotransferase [Polaribacter sp. R2A056_3_33]
MENLNRKTVAILATNGFEESELREPKKALEEAGAEVHIVSLESGEIKSWNEGNWGETYKVDKTLKEVSQENYNALMLPGGVINPDLLRNNEDAVHFVKSFFEHHKPVGAICHGPWLLAEADVLKGRNITSYSSIKTDLINAGANWVDEEVVVDKGLVTSRNPDDLPAFNAKLVEEVYEGKHKGQMA